MALSMDTDRDTDRDTDTQTHTHTQTQTHTNTNTHTAICTGSILRNQVCTGNTHVWFNNFSYYKFDAMYVSVQDNFQI